MASKLQMKVSGEEESRHLSLAEGGASERENIDMSGADGSQGEEHVVFNVAGVLQAGRDSNTP